MQKIITSGIKTTNNEYDVPNKNEHSSHISILLYRRRSHDEELINVHVASCEKSFHTSSSPEVDVCLLAVACRGLQRPATECKHTRSVIRGRYRRVHELTDSDKMRRADPVFWEVIDHQV